MSNYILKKHMNLRTYIDPIACYFNASKSEVKNIAVADATELTHEIINDT